MWIRIGFYENPDDSGYITLDQCGSGVLMNQNIKFYSRKNQIAIFFKSLALHEGRPSDRGKLQPSKENIQHFKHDISSPFSIFLRLIFAILDPEPDPVDLINADPYESGSTPLERGVCVHEHHVRQAIKEMIR